MCRVVTYLGEPILAQELLFNPDNSLVKQSYEPKFMSHIQNLAGFGMAVWDKTSPDAYAPYVYKTLELPFFNENLLQLSTKVQADCMLAHIRGIRYSPDEKVIMPNTHPFMYEGYKLALAHNGQLESLGEMKPDLLKAIPPEIAKHINGTTDSEWIYALLLSQFDNPMGDHGLDEVVDALYKTLLKLKEIRHKRKLSNTSPLNLFITNGEYLVVTRFVLDFGRYPTEFTSAHMYYHSLWYTYGERYGLFDGEHKMIGGGRSNSSVIIASEPLTEDTTTWIEVREYSLITAHKENGEVKIKTLDINI